MTDLIAEATPQASDFNPNRPGSPTTISYQSGDDFITVTQPPAGITVDFKAFGKWIGSNLASGIVGAAGGMLFGLALDAIGLGGPDLAGKLDEISKKLDQVQKTVNEIKILCTEILRQLESLRLSMDQSFGEGKLGEAFTRIDAAYGRRRPEGFAAAPSVSAPTFMELLHSLTPAMPTEERNAYADAFVKAVDTKWDITTQIVSIHDALTTNVAHSSTLLHRWTDGLLFAIADNQISLDSAYMTLEGYFLQAIGKQLTAVSMHCFALGAEPNAETRVSYYLQQEFATLMSEQTTEFLNNVERLVLARTRIRKVPSEFPLPEIGFRPSPEFPSEMESIFLHADLLCASLNLVGFKNSTGKEINLRDSVAGIYGRCLFRKQDLVDGKGPAIGIANYHMDGGQDFQGIYGTFAQTLDTMRNIDLRRDGDRLILEDYDQSAPRMARYFWPWPSRLPPQNEPIDNRFRGGIRPAYFNVFADNDWPLAAGFVFFTHTLAAAPYGTPPTLDANTLFPTNNPHTGIKQTLFVPPPTHLFVKPADNVIEWIFEHATKANGGWNRTTAFHLFKYTGAKRKLRLHINAVCEVQVDIPQKDLHKSREIDLKARVMLIHRPITGQKVYDSGEEKDGVLQLANRTNGYKATVESWAKLDFEVQPGEYSLNLDFITWIGTLHTRYDGWQADRLRFNLKGVFLEWLQLP